jgi:hypothetical protein
MSNPANINLPGLVDIELDDLKPMETGEAGGWGMTYRWVSLPVTQQNKYQNTTELATEWCIEKWGTEGVRWFEKKGRFYFREEYDRTMFILRWAS